MRIDREKDGKREFDVGSEELHKYRGAKNLAAKNDHHPNRIKPIVSNER
jgi:hypothetical protein